MKARSFKVSKGAKLKGPSHNESGIEVRQGKKPVAEVEGGERLFSQEDTEYMEAEAEKIRGFRESGDEEGANQAAMQLGYRIVEMIDKQEANVASTEEEQTQAINTFGNGEEDF